MLKATHDKIVVVTRKTPLQELVERFGTRDQARFYVEHLGTPFDDYQEAHDRYERSVDGLRAALPGKVRSQWIDRSFLPTFLFGENDLVVALGQDGLVVNIAKYLQTQPLLAFNPDPSRFDGVLLPFGVGEASWAIAQALADGLLTCRVSMARARLNDGQEMFAVNDLFLGHKSHGSARYRLEFDGTGEEQSSSGVIVSTGAGSTGWYRSIVTGAAGVIGEYSFDEDVRKLRSHPPELEWETDELIFTVREPFVSRTSSAEVIHGRIGPGESLRITSRMPQDGVIFSDGVQEDYLPFASGATAEIALADRRLHLLVPPGHGA